MLPCSYAFRAPQKSGGCPNHHDIIRNLREYRIDQGQRDIWVAECDIQGFFDSLHHRVIRRCLKNLLLRAEERGIRVEERAIEIVEACLLSYDFPTVARDGANTWFRRTGIEGVLKWPEESLERFWTRPSEEPIGVPQGGALSGFFANVVLDGADRQVMGATQQDVGDLFYARYCDDMIIAHPERDACETVFTRYLAALEKVSLPCHEPQSVNRYGPQFFSMKSKQPYRWGRVQQPGSVPWVSMVGYQVRYDAAVRIRGNTVSKELKKQVETADRVIGVISRYKTASERGRENVSGLRVTTRQVEYRLQQQLISMAVGRCGLDACGRDVALFCWVSGFEALTLGPELAAQLRRLDRGRERQIRRVRRALVGVAGKRQRGNTHKPREKFYGAPFSYYRQFEKG